jgi:hypothetical protein
MKQCLYLLVITVLLSCLFSCQKSNPLEPEISWGRIGFTEDKIPLEGNEYVYRQGMFSNSEEGSGVLYAWRITTLSGGLPEGWLADPDGWLWFRADGSDIPLSQPGPHRSIWTSQSNLSFDFQSHEGKISDLITRTELKVKSPGGGISQYASAFRSGRIIGSLISVGFQNGAETGTGIEFGLREVMGDIFVDGLYADHFMYRVNILDEDLDVITEGEWYNSLEMTDIRRVKLNTDTYPALVINAPGQYTQFESYVVTRQGIEEAARHTVYFQAKGTYKPKALIYSQTLAALGTYHYSIWQEDPLNGYDLIPATDNRRNKNLWSTDDGYELINSPDLKLHLQWGYHGQYASQYSSPLVEGWDYPFGREVNTCLDADTDENYYSKVEYFDLRLNGSTFPYLGQFILPEYITHHGRNWLRVRNANDNARHCILEGLADGELVLEVCAVDLQGAVSDPASVSISLLPFKPWESRSGILIVDDSFSSSALSPEDYVDSFYESVLPTTWGAIDAIDIHDEGLSYTGVPATLLQDYKAVVWHSDNPSDAGHLAVNADPLDIYLGMEGRLVLSSTVKLASILQNMSMSAPSFSSGKLGIGSQSDYFALSNSLVSDPFFVEAQGMDNNPDIGLNVSDAFNPLVHNFQGLGSVTCFNPSLSQTFTHRFGCKPVDSLVAPPTQAEYDLYSSKYVGYTHEGVAVFGFPLSYMEQDDVENALSVVLHALLDPMRPTKGGRK